VPHAVRRRLVDVAPPVDLSSVWLILCDMASCKARGNGAVCSPAADMATATVNLGAMHQASLLGIRRAVPQGQRCAQFCCCRSLDTHCPEACMLVELGRNLC
jgi:hypothetical protein